MIDWQKIQREHTSWTLDNFGAQEAHQPFMGIVEETGELDIAYTHEERVDAIGDCMVYWVGLCTSLGYDAASLMERVNASDIEPTVTMTRTLGVIAHYILKLQQNIRQDRAPQNREIARSALEDYVRLVEWKAATFAISLEEATEQTWNEVKKRNWKKNPNTGEAT